MDWIIIAIVLVAMAVATYFSINKKKKK